MDTDKENVVAGSKESSRRNSKASKQSPKSTEVSSKKTGGQDAKHSPLKDKAAELESSPEQKFQRKWPVTRGERIEELNELSGHYEHITQKDNINAVKDWHSKFLLDQTITNETVFFQQGKRVEWSDLDDDHGVIWEEGPVLEEWSPPDFTKFPWNYVQKWPVTRGERIQELDDLLQHYEKTPQKDNVIAAKAWHSQFPPDEVVSDEQVCFQKGRKLEGPKSRPEDGFVWREGPPVDNFMMAGGQQQPSSRLPPPGPAAGTLSKAQWTYYDRSTNSHMYQV